ncbi:hypothetical protein ACRALDRAFT_2035480 [Sodiomyces alcalophilus JCM 7366]|uniref:uncharacterized protein n=1 Tax=Sodiomyces alcalophilus JCM 7366 TaxID=591952 RepID=UPI0039B670F2
MLLHRTVSLHVASVLGSAAPFHHNQQARRYCGSRQRETALDDPTLQCESLGTLDMTSLSRHLRLYYPSNTTAHLC